MCCQYHPRPIIVNNEKSENHTPCHSCSSQSLKENRLKGMINASKSGDSQTNFELPVNNRDSHSHLRCTQSYKLRRRGQQKHFSFGQANNSGGIIHVCRGCDYPREVWKIFRFLDLWNCTCGLFRHHTANIGPVVTMSTRSVMPPLKEEMFPFLSFRGYCRPLITKIKSKLKVVMFTTNSLMLGSVLYQNNCIVEIYVPQTDFFHACASLGIFF